MSNKNSILEIIKAPLAMLAIFLLKSNCAFAREEILSFISHIHIYEDSNIAITEDIAVQAEHNKIKRGIYRDFPTNYQGLLGNKIKVDFEIVEVLKNGTKEPFHTKTLNNGIRIYIGNKSKYDSRGKHIYTIKYKTTQQLGFFTKHDELYWNVTGNGWEFPILEAKANVYLPKSISVNDVRLEAFTGRIGSTNIDYMSEISPSGNFIYQTTKPLLSNEGLTIVVAWPKGLITEPDLT